MRRSYLGRAAPDFYTRVLRRELWNRPGNGKSNEILLVSLKLQSRSRRTILIVLQFDGSAQGEESMVEINGSHNAPLAALPSG